MITAYMYFHGIHETSFMHFEIPLCWPQRDSPVSMVMVRVWFIGLRGTPENLQAKTT